MKKFLNIALWTLLTMGVGSWIGRTITLYSAILFVAISVVVTISFLSSGAAKKQPKITLVLVMTILMAATAVVTMVTATSYYATELVVLSVIGLIVQWIGSKLA